jgi:hypothetical protein
MKVVTLLPHITKLATEMTRPLFENIDVVRYTQMSRALKTGEEYARRLLSTKYPKSVAGKISRALVENYPVHSFVIDYDEMVELGLNPIEASPDLLPILDRIAGHCAGQTAVGPLVTMENMP